VEVSVVSALVDAGVALLVAEAALDVAPDAAARGAEGARVFVFETRHRSQERDEYSQPEDPSNHGASDSRLAENVTASPSADI
jgi:hypothetical protein